MLEQVVVALNRPAAHRTREWSLLGRQWRAARLPDAQHLMNACSQRFFFAEAEHAFGRGIEQRDASVDIDREHAFTDACRDCTAELRLDTRALLRVFGTRPSTVGNQLPRVDRELPIDRDRELVRDSVWERQISLVHALAALELQCAENW